MSYQMVFSLLGTEQKISNGYKGTRRLLNGDPSGLLDLFLAGASFDCDKERMAGCRKQDGLRIQAVEFFTS